MALLAGIVAFVGWENERLKWRIIGLAMLVVSVIVGAIFGFSIYVEPIAGLLARYG